MFAFVAWADITVRTMTDDYEFLVMACDGIWDVMTNPEVVEFVRNRFAQHMEPKRVCYRETIFSRDCKHWDCCGVCWPLCGWAKGDSTSANVLTPPLSPLACLHEKYPWKPNNILFIYHGISVCRLPKICCTHASRRTRRWAAWVRITWQ